MAYKCMNKMTIKHHDSKKMKIAIDSARSNKLLATLLPEPDYSAIDPAKFPSILGERCANLDEVRVTWRAIFWNSCNDISCDVNFYDRKLDKLYIEFESRHAAPIAAYGAIVSLGYSLEASYYSPGGQFVGLYNSDGRNCDITIKSWHWRWIKRNIPDRLIQEFDLASRAEGRASKVKS